MKYLMPQMWRGWTAVIMVAVFIIAAVMLNGKSRFLRAAAWLGAVIVGAVAIYNEIKGGR